MDNDVETEQGFREIYYNPATGYQSAEQLYNKALEEGLNVSRKAVKEWLKTQNTYTRFKPIVRRHGYRQTFVGYLGEQVKMDLVDMGKYKRNNGTTLQQNPQESRRLCGSTSTQREPIIGQTP